MGDSTVSESFAGGSSRCAHACSGLSHVLLLGSLGWCILQVSIRDCAAFLPFSLCVGKTHRKPQVLQRRQHGPSIIRQGASGNALLRKGTSGMPLHTGASKEVKEPSAAPTSSHSHHTAKTQSVPPSKETPAWISESLRLCLAQVQKEAEQPFESGTCFKDTLDPGGAWFPHGDDIVRNSDNLSAALDDIVEHELRPFLGGITDNIIRQSWEAVKPTCDSGCCFGPDVMGVHVRGRGFTDDWRRYCKNERVTRYLDTMMRRQAGTGSLPASVDFLYEALDWPMSYKPGRIMACPDKRLDKLVTFETPRIVFVSNKRVEDNHSIAFPDWTYIEEGTAAREASRVLQWSNRTARLLFIGTGLGYRSCMDPAMLNKRTDALEIIYRGGCDPGAGPWCNKSRKMTRPEHCKYKYLLHLPGTRGTYSSRLRHLFFCASVVIIPQQAFYEFWYPMLRPYEHFIPAGNLMRTRGRDLPGIVNCLQQHDEDARQLAERAGAFADAHLMLKMKYDYVRKLLHRYAALSQYNMSNKDWDNLTKLTP